MDNTYDYQLYDRIWRRVIPGNPYPNLRQEPIPPVSMPKPPQPVMPPQTAQPAQPTAPQQMTAPPLMAVPPQPVPAQPMPGEMLPPLPTGEARTDEPAVNTFADSAGDSGTGEEHLFGEELNPCCMGTVAQNSVLVLRAFLDQSAEERCYYLAMARRVRNREAAALLRQLANDEANAAKQLSAALYLITGTCYTPKGTRENLPCRSLQEYLRAAYHEVACNGFNYLRAAEDTRDLCLKNMLNQIGDLSFQRAEAVLDLLGRLISNCGCNQSGNT